MAGRRAGAIGEELFWFIADSGDCGWMLKRGARLMCLRRRRFAVGGEAG
jgi:hypothetical protein